MGTAPKLNSFEESSVKFHFFSPTIQYDSTDYYRRFVLKLPSTKAVDFITVHEGRTNIKRLYLMEVKNFEVNNRETKERTNPDGRDPLHIEIAQKVKDTLAGLVGAMTLADRECFSELAPYHQFIRSKEFLQDRLVVIAFIEGSRLSGYGKGHKNGELGLQRAIEKSLKWLNCEVRVLNRKAIQEYNIDWFEAE